MWFKATEFKQPLSNCSNMISLLFMLAQCGVAIPIRAAHADEFLVRLPVYVKVRPQFMSTAVAINQGIVTALDPRLGRAVKTGEPLIQVMEKETTRSYRSSLNAQVAKVHVSLNATVTPGMPLVTVIDAAHKLLEVDFSPSEINQIKVGAEVFLAGTNELLGHVTDISPLVDPDTGSIKSTIKAATPVSAYIGSLIAADVITQRINDCILIPVAQLAHKKADQTLVAVSGDQACLRQSSSM